MGKGRRGRKMSWQKYGDSPGAATVIISLTGRIAAVPQTGGVHHRDTEGTEERGELF